MLMIMVIMMIIMVVYQEDRIYNTDHNHSHLLCIIIHYLLFVDTSYTAPTSFMLLELLSGSVMHCIKLTARLLIHSLINCAYSYLHLPRSWCIGSKSDASWCHLASYLRWALSYLSFSSSSIISIIIILYIYISVHPCIHLWFLPPIYRSIHHNYHPSIYYPLLSCISHVYLSIIHHSYHLSIDLSKRHHLPLHYGSSVRSALPGMLSDPKGAIWRSIKVGSFQ